MFSKADNSAAWAVGRRAGAVLHRRPAHHRGAAAGGQELGHAPLRACKPYTEIQLKGRAIYVREGCWYCHTQQTRTLVSDTKRSGWRGVDSPISTPDEFVYDKPHMFGTKRTGPDLSRVGGKYDTQWHRTHFRNPRDLVPGSVMPPFPWIVEKPEEFTALVAYIQTLGRAKDWRPDKDYEK